MPHPATPQGNPRVTAALPALGSLAHRYCDDHDYGGDEFMPAVMRACLARRARPIYWILGHTAFFSADRELAAEIAHARSMDQVEDAIDEYWTHPANRRWLRLVAGVRLSTQRLRRFAGDYLPFKKFCQPERRDGKAP